MKEKEQPFAIDTTQLAISIFIARNQLPKHIDVTMKGDTCVVRNRQTDSFVSFYAYRGNDNTGEWIDDDLPMAIARLIDQPVEEKSKASS
tara:strand:+ start:293 stop:562 length:270 start_codon:yes stop_codon:yes gene_type:complete